MSVSFSRAKMIKLLIYDLDGTLIDSRRDIADSVNWTLRELGLAELPIEIVSDFVGNGVKNLIEQSLEAASPKNQATHGKLPSLKKSIKLFRGRYGEHLLDHTCLYPSVRKVLEFFKGRKQAVITNKPENFSLEILKGLGVETYFHQVIGGDKGFPKKPAPEPVFELLETCRVKREEAVLIGDSDTDIKTGRNAGVKTIAVTYGFGKRPALEAAQPDFILEDLEELVECPLMAGST